MILVIVVKLSSEPKCLVIVQFSKIEQNLVFDKVYTLQGCMRRGGGGRGHCEDAREGVFK